MEVNGSFTCRHDVTFYKSKEQGGSKYEISEDYGSGSCHNNGTW